MKHPVERLGVLDYILAWIAASLAVYSAGVGVGVAEIGYFFVGIMAIGATISYITQRIFRDTWLMQLDGLVFFLSGALSAYFVVGLNRSLPDLGFPPTLILASGLCWMLAFWSFTMWRDGTLLFPCVPAVALFSLVGSWDSFSGATFAFFGFLLSFATLFARSQRRGMALRAKESGFIELERLRLGPWKWMAGPEWALASAAVVVLISLVGAPVLQLSVQGVAGFVKINTPPPRPAANPIQPTDRETMTGVVQVGQGPRELSHTPIMWVGMDDARYLRTKTFDIYTGRGWRVVPDFADAAERSRALRDPNSLVSLSRLAIKDGETLDVSIAFLSAGHDSLPSPGQVAWVDPNSGDVGLRPDGTLSYIVTNRRPPDAFAKFIVPPTRSVPVEASSKLKGNYTNESNNDDIQFSVASWAKELVKDASSDYEKAMLIKREIERICVYNLNAAAVPTNKDAVATFLFDNREGYCDLFASAMAVAARAVGLPARYVQGYFPTTGDVDERGRFVIYQSDYHAWCEILFEGTGWTVFDATEGATNVDGGERGGATVKEPFYKLPWFGPALFGLMGLATLGGMGAVWRTNRRAFLALGPRAELSGRYEKLANAMEKASGRPRRLDESPRAYYEATRDQLGDTAKGVTATFENLMYGPANPTKEDYREVAGQIKVVSKALRKIRPRRR